MLAAKAKLKEAEKVKKILIKNNLLNQEYLPIKEFDYIYFPIIKKSSKIKTVNTKLSFKKKKKQYTIEDLLKNKLTKTELQSIPKSQEIVGKILILEIPDELEKKEKIIAEAYLKLNNNIETVVRKEQIHEGTFRTRKVKILAGKQTKETIHYENGVKLKLHLDKSYFSARLANERLRIAKMIKKGEDILVMFSGVAPYPAVIAKNSEVKSIVGVEINTRAHYYAMENIKPFENVKVYLGDVATVLPKIKQNFDRVIMPLPKTSEEFLYLALPRAKKMIHLYAFLNERDIAKETKKIKELCKKYSVKILRKVKCGQFSPGTFRWCFDLKIMK